jgi:hypothetical protein
MELAFQRILSFVVGVFVRVKLQETDEVIEQVLSYVEFLSPDVVLLAEFFEEGDLFAEHQVVKTHQQDSVTAQTLHLALQVNQIPIHSPVFYHVAEFENILVFGIQGQHFAIFESFVIIDDNVHGRHDILVLSKVTVVNYLDKGDLDLVFLEGFRVYAVGQMGFIGIDGFAYLNQCGADSFPMFEVQTLVVQADVDIGVLEYVKLALKGTVGLETDFFFVAAFEQELCEELVLLLILLPPFFVEVNADNFSLLAEDLVISDD